MSTTAPSTRTLIPPPLVPVPPEDLLNPAEWRYVDHSGDLPALCKKRVAAMLVAPRRFGKSTLLSLRRAYLELPNADAQRLFGPFRVAGTLQAAIDAGRTPVPVIQLGLNIEARYVGGEQSAKNAGNYLVDAINTNLMREAQRLARLPDDVTPPSTKALLQSYQPHPDNVKTSLQGLLSILQLAAINIDEFDYCVLQSVLEQEPLECRRAREQVLQELLSAIKDNPSVHSTVATGITVHMWRSLSSAANFLTLLNDQHHSFRPRLGYTWAEVLAAFEPQLQDIAKASTPPRTMDELKTDLTWMYDGYRFRPDDEPLFNPWSINSLVTNQPDDGLKGYWAKDVSHIWTDGLVHVDVINQIQSSALPMTPEVLFGCGASTAAPGGLDEIQQHCLLVHAGVLSPQPSTDRRNWLVSMPNGEVRSITVQNLLQRLYGISTKNLDLLRLREAQLLASGALPQFFEDLWPCISFPHNKIDLPAAEQGDAVVSAVSVDARVVSAGLATVVKSFLQQARTKGFNVTVFAEATARGASRDRMDIVFLRQSTDGVASPPTLEVVEFAVVEPGHTRAPRKRRIKSKLEDKKQQLARYHSQLALHPAVCYSMVTLQYWTVLINRDGSLISTTSVATTSWQVPPRSAVSIL